MATWKKVIVSGSNADLNRLNVGTNQQISSSVADTRLSGSFSGSFSGYFSGSTDLPNLTQGAGISTFTYDGSSTATVAVSGAAQLTDNTLTKWDAISGKFVNSSLYDGGTSITGSSSIKLTGITSSLSGSFSGSFQGDGSNLTGIVTNLLVYGDGGISGSIDLKTQNLKVLGTAGEIDTALSLNPMSDGYTVQVGLPSNVKITQDLFVTGSVTALGGFTGSFSGSAVLPALTQGTGISAFTYNGSGTANVAVSGASSLSSNTLTKWDGSKFLNSNISDNGSLVTVSSNTTFNNNVTISGDLTVNGTASFINTQELLVKDKFTTFNSGSNSLTDAGFIFQYTTGSNGAASGSALYLDSANGTYGRLAVQYGVPYDAMSVTADEWVITTKLSTSNPLDATPPTWGSSNGQGNMWVNTNTSDIFIWA
jgi:hypothetical protein